MGFRAGFEQENPPGHCTHTIPVLVFLYDPEAQVVQLPLPGELVCPSGQADGDEEPSGQEDPAGHGFEQIVAAIDPE